MTYDYINHIKNSCAVSELWVRRQSYALLCSELITTDSINGRLFSTNMLQPLVDLCNDQVANVRLVVAKTLARDVVTKDRKFDVAFFMHMFLVLFYVQLILMLMEFDNSQLITIFG